ncbi:MAG: 50S ribosomal protein L6 [Candidatus Geothermarchaeales archaeon]
MTGTTRRVYSAEVAVPEGIGVEIRDRSLVVQGALGTAKKDFAKVPVDFEIAVDKIAYVVNLKGKRGYALSNTIRSLINNLFTGVTKGYTYRMKVYYAHFPFTVQLSGRTVHIDNFAGERAPRKARIVGDATVEAEEDEVIVTGTSKQDVSQTAANIRQACHIRGKDPRVFLDGIYVYSKEEGMPLA